MKLFYGVVSLREDSRIDAGDIETDFYDFNKNDFKQEWRIWRLMVNSTPPSALVLTFHFIFFQ